jgi:hypothetical protein
VLDRIDVRAWWVSDDDIYISSVLFIFVVARMRDVERLERKTRHDGYQGYSLLYETEGRQQKV